MRLLLVEDEAKVASFIRRGLEAERYAVDVAADGNCGLELAQTYSYDLIILDLMLPGLSGTEVLRRVRQQSEHVPVLVLTARDALADKVQHFEAGADDYLTKPFAFAELLVRVKALLRRGAVSRANTLRVGDLELDRVTQQVRRGGQRLELTAKEYALLEYLMLNAGRVLSRTMIIEHVWDQSFDGATNIVDVYVRHLRNKVDEPHGSKLIRTVRGVGYVISDEEGVGINAFPANSFDLTGEWGRADFDIRQQFNLRRLNLAGFIGNLSSPVFEQAVRRRFDIVLCQASKDSTRSLYLLRKRV